MSLFSPDYTSLLLPSVFHQGCIFNAEALPYSEDHLQTNKPDTHIMLVVLHSLLGLLLLFIGCLGLKMHLGALPHLSYWKGYTSCWRTNVDVRRAAMGQCTSPPWWWAVVVVRRGRVCRRGKSRLRWRLRRTVHADTHCLLGQCANNHWRGYFRQGMHSAHRWQTGRGDYACDGSWRYRRC